MQPVRVPLATKIKQQIEKAGYFSRIKVNSIYVPQQLRVQFTAKNTASDEVAAGKPTTGAATLFLATAFVLINLGVDLLYAYLDPRIKQG